MNIIEAIKSGKPYKRRHWAKFCNNVDNNNGVVFSGERCQGLLTLSPKDILADDWEIEEKKITISEEQLKLMAERLCDSFMFVNNDSLRRSELFTFFKKELGF